MSTKLPVLSTGDLDRAAGGQAARPPSPVPRQEGPDNRTWVKRLGDNLRARNDIDEKMVVKRPNPPDAIEKPRPGRPPGGQGA